MLSAPERTKNNYRAYSSQHLARLSFIRRARALGFSLDQVQALLGLSDQKDISCSAVDLIAREHLAEIDHKLKDLTTLRSELSSLIVQCGTAKSPNAALSRPWHMRASARSEAQALSRYCK
ncbi:MerR family DNA-binding protein [Sphingobium sp. C100]|uniref:MerR family DNA-binding protein n=1 Tax=Sphingobium sp. C100 TaxID=1207055 RepID=UPI003FA375EA